MKSKSLVMLMLLGLYGAALLFRLWFTSGANLGFHYEVARDVLSARSIYTSGDLKIMGPPAGNSDEKIYHGVLYYYVIGLFYALAEGDPRWVIRGLAMISSLAVIPAFMLGWRMTNKVVVGLITACLVALSLTLTEMGTHLFNISLASVSIPVVYYLAGRVFVDNQTRLLIPLALAMGVTFQSGIYLAYIVIPVSGLWAYRFYRTGKLKVGSRANLIGAGVVLTLAVSTMILTQIKLYRAGVFGLSDILSANQSHLDWWGGLMESGVLFFGRASHVYLSANQIAGLVGLGVIGWIIRKELRTTWGSLIMLWLGSTLGFLVIMPRITYYMTVGMPVAILVGLAIGIDNIAGKGKIGVVTAVMLIGVYMGSNLVVALEHRSDRKSELYSGAYLSEQMAVVDQAYEWSGGEEFSISALTSPYGVVTTWGYMFDWYGKNKYGYKPRWFGSDQTGLPGEGLLERIDNVERIHVVIYEPYFGNEDVLKKSFEELQQIYAPKLIETRLIGDQKMELRAREPIPSGR